MKRIVGLVLFCWAAAVCAQEMPVLELEKGVSKAQLQLLNDLAVRKKWREQQAKSAPSDALPEVVMPDFTDEPLSPAVQMYLYMSPADAARLLSSMPEEEAFDIFKRIPSYRSALILAKLPEDVAKRWTLRLAGQND